MISLVWSPGEPLPAGTGGSENYTIGQVRELNRRGVPTQVVTIGLGDDDGRNDFPGVPFKALKTVAQVSQLDGTVIFATWFPKVTTAGPAYQMLHVPPPVLRRERSKVREQARHRVLIATSRFAARMWAEFFEVDSAAVQVVYPFAEPHFGRQPRQCPQPALPRQPRRTRILYAGRLSPEKGIFTLLAMLHNEIISDAISGGTQMSFTVTTAGSDKPQGRVIRTLLEVHPGIRLIPARKTPAEMAALMAEHDIVVMPSNSQYWHETFGIVSIEAQHSGCRVVASDDGGLPETDCGALKLVAPDDAAALARGVCEAIAAGPVAPGLRAAAATKFTVGQSVDQLLHILGRPRRTTIRKPISVATGQLGTGTPNRQRPGPRPTRKVASARP